MTELVKADDSSASKAEMEAQRPPLAGAEPLEAYTWYTINKAAQHIRQLVETELLELGLRRRHFATLHLLEVKESLTQQELSEAIPIDRATVVGVVDDLEKRKLAERKVAPKDRRVYRIRILPEGQKLLEEAKARVANAERSGLAVLSKAEQQQLHELTCRLCGWSPDQKGT